MEGNVCIRDQVCRIIDAFNELEKFASIEG